MSNADERLNGSKSALPTRPSHEAGFGKNGTETELDMVTEARGATQVEDTRAPQMEDTASSAGRATAAKELTKAMLSIARG
jgi:hypothetical protein